MSTPRPNLCHFAFADGRYCRMPAHPSFDGLCYAHGTLAPRASRRDNFLRVLCVSALASPHSHLGGRNFSLPRASRGPDIKSPPLPQSCAGRCTRHEASFSRCWLWTVDREPIPNAGRCNQHEDSCSSCSPLVYPELSRWLTRHSTLSANPFLCNTSTTPPHNVLVCKQLHTPGGRGYPITVN